MARQVRRGNVECGQQVASSLTGCWRPAPLLVPPAPEVLAEVVPLLLAGGTGGLAWWRLSGAPFARDTRFRPLHHAFRLYTLETAVEEDRLREVYSLLRAEGVEPILIKGPASARHYPGPGLRPFGDIDLCVRPDQFNLAWDTLLRADRLAGVDLHTGVPDLPDRTWEQVEARSQLVPLGRGEIRILGPEDHLRLLGTHMIRHGAWRPLWLCDLAAALEGRSPDFDWDYCLHGDPVLSGWVVWALGLARRLLEAQIDEPGVAEEAERVPAWVVRSVLWRWGAGRRKPVSYYLRHPRKALAGLCYLGLNPIKATFRLGLRPRSRLLVVLAQLGAFAVRSQVYACSRVRQLPRPRVLFPCRLSRRPDPAREGLLRK